MSEKLLSLGLDVGTTSTQLVLSELTVENRAGSFAVPELEIGERKVLYKSPVHFTPLLREELVDGEAIRQLLDRELEQAGVEKSEIDTGAVIITGETCRKENAGAVLGALSDYAGDFVVATAGPDLESVLAAKGAGAAEFSRHSAKPVLHFDIGGGTSNLALLRQGEVVGTSCLNVGGRLLKMDPAGRLSYVSPVLEGLFAPKVGDYVNQKTVLELARTLVQALEMAAGRREKTPLYDRLLTPGAGTLEVPPEAVISFSGGVADCVEDRRSFLAFGDLGPELGWAIRESLLCQGDYRLGQQTIRATVIGAGSHSAQLSGSTVYSQNVQLPMKNLPVAVLTREQQALPAPELAELIRQKRRSQDLPPVLALPGMNAPDYGAVAVLARSIAEGAEGPLLIALEEDMAKALGQQLALRLGPREQVLCIDRVRLREGDYLDVGVPVGPALPVVVKTLALH